VESESDELLNQAIEQNIYKRNGKPEKTRTDEEGGEGRQEFGDHCGDASITSEGDK